MEDSFKVRVERLFGSHLFESVPKSSFPVASWSVTDGEVERREWNRERGVDPTRDDTPCASAFDDKGGCFASRPRAKARRFDDEDEEEDGEDGGGGGGDGNDEGEIRASVGLDPTLDREDEEDEYDRTAVGKEDTDGRIYMRDIKNHGPFMNYHSIVSDFLDDSMEDLDGFCRDSRADHLAANIRLDEDREIHGIISAASSGDNNVSGVDDQVKSSTSENLRPILKRKENQMEVRPNKKVRFDPDHHHDSMVSNDNVEGGKMVDVGFSELSKHLGNSSGVPDYIRNPSKYTRYSFDTYDKSDDQLNRQAFQEFCNIISKSKSSDANMDCGTELPKSLVFIPRKKLREAVVTDLELDTCENSNRNVSRGAGIAAGDACESETCVMDEDEVGAFVEEKHKVSQKMDRKYRSKAISDISDS